MMTKAKSQSNSHINRFILENPAFDFVTKQKKGLDPSLAYVAAGDKILEKELKNAILDSANNLMTLGLLEAITVNFVANPEWESTADDSKVHVRAIMTEKRHIARSNPYSVTQLLYCYVLDEGTQKLVHMPALGTIGFIRKSSEQSIRSGSPRKRDTRQSLSPRPGLQNMYFDQPSLESINEAVTLFVTMGFHLRDAARVLAMGTNAEAWDKFAEARQFGLAQMRTLLPAAKFIFGVGEGEQIVERAFINPNRIAKNAKKAKIAPDRDEVLDLWWNDAMRNPTVRHRPPFIKV